jgi:hypothetical protein
MQTDLYFNRRGMLALFITKAVNLHTVAYPFDWNAVPFNVMLQCVNEDFENFHKGLRLNNDGKRVVDLYGFNFRMITQSIM